MLTHNAPRYVELAVRSVRARTTGVNYELVIVDNASDSPTRDLVIRLREQGLIDRLHLSDWNSLFAEGNNIASRQASPDATHYLLLNSDVRVMNRHWLERLLSVHKPGITSFGVVPRPVLADGYCLLIDAGLYREHPLDSERHQWTWAVTRQQAALLAGGYSVQGFAHHGRYLHHFGGKSGVDYLDARGMDVTLEEVTAWFAGHQVVVLDGTPKAPSASFVSKGFRKIINGALRSLPV